MVGSSTPHVSLNAQRPAQKAHWNREADDWQSEQSDLPLWEPISSHLYRVTVFGGGKEENSIEEDEQMGENGREVNENAEDAGKKLGVETRSGIDE